MAELASFLGFLRRGAQEVRRRRAARGRQARELPAPGERGPGGEALYLDVSVLGPGTASRVFVVGSGTHGIEGYSGSAAQRAWLRSRPRLPRTRR
jgi:hypothetical protein